MMAHQTSSGQRLVIRIGSIAIALLIVVGLGLKIQWDARYHSLEQAKAEWPERFFELQSERYEKYEDVLDRITGTRKTPDEIIELLGAGTVHVVDNEFFHRFYDRDWLVGMGVFYESEINLGAGEFVVTDVVKDGLVDGGDGSGTLFHYDYPAIIANSAPKVDRLSVELQFESASKILVAQTGVIGILWTLLPWAGFLIAAWLFKERRPLLFAGAIWLVALSGLVLMMGPRYELLSETMKNDPLFWIVLMLLITVGGIIWDKIESRPDPAVCPMCGYMLKGNTTGQCPECGVEIESTQRKYLEQLT